MRRFLLVAVLALLASPLAAQDAATPIQDRSVASLSGSSQQLFPDVGPRGVVERYVCNPSAASSLAINLSGGTAALNTAGSVTLGPGQCWSGRVSNKITVIGTAGQGVTAGSR
jgi:opacity protein-like surface antigen